jgi:hypothetical protein
MLSNQRHKVYPGSGRGPYVQQWCARGTILISTGVPVVGRLQARRERRCGLRVPSEVNGMSSDVVGELGNVSVCCVASYVVCCLVSCCVVCCLLSCVLCLVSCPLRRGSSPFFYRPRRGRITSMPHYSATWGSMVCNTVE